MPEDTKPDKMLEGKELSGTFGDYGSYDLDITDKLDVSVNITLKADLVDILKKQTANVNNSLVTRVVNMIARFTGKDGAPSLLRPAGQTDRTGASVGKKSSSTGQDQNTTEDATDQNPDPEFAEESQKNQEQLKQPNAAKTDLEEANTTEPKKGNTV